MFEYDASLPVAERLRTCRQQIAQALEAAEHARTAELRQGYLRIAAGWASVAIDLEFEMEAAGQRAEEPIASRHEAR